MKTLRFLAGLLVMVLILVGAEIAFAEQKSITLPKGTTVEKLGSGHFKFKLPDRSIIEVKEFNPKTGAVGYVSIMDPDPPHKPVIGKQGKFQGQARSKVIKLPRGAEYVLIDDDIAWLKQAPRVAKSDYVMIDDDIAWLPATLIFQPAGVVDPDPPHKPRGLSPQPDPPGKK